MEASSNIAQDNSNHGKLLFLDGFRGYAALWVLISHALSYVGCKAFPLLQKGNLAVDVFIIMSGFLMAYHYCKREPKEAWDAPSTWINFYVRRFFRIAPLYYFLLIISFALNDYFSESRVFINTVFPSEWFVKEFGSPSTFFDYKYMGATFLNVFLHITFLFGLIPQYATSTPLPDWSIGLEMQFYALFPFIMLTYKKFSYVWTTILLLGISVVSEKAFNILNFMPAGFSEPFPLPSFLFLKIDLFMVGIILASAYQKRDKSPSLSAWLTGLAIVLSTLTGSLIILAVCILISLFLFYDKLRDFLRIERIIRLPEKFLSNQLATFMADTSYSVYLTHTLIMAPIAAFLMSYPSYIDLPGVVRFSILFVASIPITYGISWLLFNWIEKSGIEVGKIVLKNVSTKEFFKSKA